MEFKSPYLNAMRVQAPKLFNRLRKTGALDRHVDGKLSEFKTLVDEMLVNEPRLPNGAVRNLAAKRQTEEIALAQLIEFPSEETTAAVRFAAL